MRLVATTILCALGVLALSARGPVAPAISGVALERNGNKIEATFTVDAAAIVMKSRDALILEPKIVSGADTVSLPPAAVYGRRGWIHAERQGRLAAKAVRASQDHPYVYEGSTSWHPWMDGAALVIFSHTECCCNVPAYADTLELARHYEPVVYTPEVIYAARPKVDMPQKTRELSGRANVEFVVNKTDIRPDYRNNHAELAKIRASIDSVRGDADVTITGIWLKGFASPESPYTHNADLARGRVAAVKGYVRDLYSFPNDLVATDYEPEDWAGLREYVVASNLDGREGILALIDGDLEPDAKEAAIRKAYPQDYKHLLTYCYPGLRHTDYRIEYVIREFTDPEEIRRMAMINPTKLSANEFHLAAQTLESGSAEFNELYRIAAQLYPNDPTANLNAASAAAARGDYALARTYLAKAGDSPEADYMRGALLLADGDQVAAEPLLRRAAEAGVPQAWHALEAIARMRAREAYYKK